MVGAVTGKDKGVTALSVRRSWSQMSLPKSNHKAWEE